MASESDSSILVVDVGNTNVVLGIWTGSRLTSSWRLATARERTADEYGILARQLVDGAVTQSPTGAIVASVVPPLNGAIRTMLNKYFGIDPLFVEPGIRTGVSLRVENPLEVGADRIANAVAAHGLHGGPMIVVDFGTATTFDLISEAGEYRGGVIAPGLTISAEALFARAARLPRVDIRRPLSVIGSNTVSNMQSGIYFGYIGLVDGIVARMKKEVPGIRRVVATGGLASVLAEDSESIDEHDDELTLKGLKMIWDLNAGRGKRTR